MKSLALLFLLPLLLVSASENAFGHGVGSETFPPVDLDGRQVTVEVSSSQSDPETNDDQQISVSLIDFDSKVTLRDVTFHIKAERGDQFLFEQEFKADNGFLVFNFVSEETDSIVIEEESDSNLLSSLLGLESRLIHIKGPRLSEGGLYKLDVTVLGADGYSRMLDEPLVFNAGISIAQTTRHDFADPNFGDQYIDVITYYDEISGFAYDPGSKEITFSMPFEWSHTNINQTTVVHEELVIPREFGDLLVSGFTVYVNGVRLSDDIVTIDDFLSDERVVHFIIYQRELLRVLEDGSNENGMNFLVVPDRDYPHLSAVTENGQFRILVSWEPESLESGSDARISFGVTDVFLKDKPVSTDYEFSVTQDGRTIFEQDGTSTDSREEYDVAEFVIPQDVTGIVHLNFDNLDGNDLARTSIPVVVDRAQPPKVAIPDWIRNNALWWSEGQIDDDTFVLGIQYLIQHRIIVIPQTQQESSEPQEIPSWIRNNAGWWATGQIDDDTFVQGLEYLVRKGIIRV